jgi:carboxypeptidase family protein
MKSDRLDHLRIASPCPVGWAQMSGDDRVRFCEQCSLRVYNLSELTRSEAEALIANTEGRICARLFRRSDGTIITKDCPVGLRAIRRRVAKVAGAAFAAIMSICVSVAGQKPAKEKSSCQQQVRITRKVADSAISEGEIAGVVFDPNGAVVAGAKITITNQKTKATRETVSDDEGRFKFASLAPVSYDLTLTQSGFKKLELKSVTLATKETVNLDLILMLDATTVTMGVIGYDSPASTPPGTTILSGETIRKLPIQQ